MSNLSRTISIEGTVSDIIDDPIKVSEAIPETEEYEAEPAEYSVMVKLIVHGEQAVADLRRMADLQMMFIMVND